MAFESIGWFGYFGFPESARPWQNQLLWDKSSSCSIDINQSWICGILYAIFGYQVTNQNQTCKIQFLQIDSKPKKKAVQSQSVPQNAFLDQLCIDVEHLVGMLKLHQVSLPRAALLCPQAL